MDIKLHEKLRRLQWLLHQYNTENYFNETMKNDSLEQNRVIKILKAKDGMTINELSYLSGSKESFLNELLVKLEKKGYIFFKNKENIEIIYLTRKGYEENQVENEINEALSCLSKKEQDIFQEYINRIIESLDKEIGLEHKWNKVFNNIQFDEEYEEDKFEDLFDMHEICKIYGSLPDEDFENKLSEFGVGKGYNMSCNYEYCDR